MGRSLLSLAACAAALAGAAVASAAPLKWSAPTAIDPSPATATHAITAMSCPSATLCVAGDDQGDLLASTSPSAGASAWKAARRIDPGVAIKGISCPSAKLCVAVTGGDIITSSHPTAGFASWKLTRGVVAKSAGFTGVSCASTKLCVAVDGAGVRVSTHPTGGKSSWKAASVNIPGRHDRLVDVSCPSTSLCIAVDRLGGYVASAGHPARGSHAWKLTKIGTPTQSAGRPPGLTCASTKLCLIVGTNKNPGNAYVASSTHPSGGKSAWKVVRHVPAATGNLSSVSCASAKLCVAAGDPFVGSVVASTDPTGGSSAWKATLKPKFEDEGATGVSCPSVSLCVLIGDAPGAVLTSPTPTVSGSWTTATVDALNELDAVDCLSASFCVAGGSGGRVLTSTAPTTGAAGWSASTINLSPTTIACPSISLCVTTGDVGKEGLNVAVSTNPTAGASSWQYAETTMDEDGAASNGQLSCPSVSFCIVPAYQVQSDSDLEATTPLTSSNPSGGTSAWTLSGEIIDGGTNGGPKPGDGDVVAISCASTTSCVGVDDGGRVVASTTPANAASWRRRSVDGKNVFTGISCPATNLCAAIDAAGNVVTSKTPLSGGWKVAKIDAGKRLVSISCASAGLCVAVDAVGNSFTATSPAGGAAAWKRTGGIDVGITAVSCPTTSLCVAVDNDGNAVVGTP